ncbi:MAG: type II toxin-antitoxin system RelE/ParE family toxin [Leptospirillum sp.]
MTRVFKTSWFSKAARKSGIRDSELLKAMSQIMEGKADDLGGGVFKKRLNDNMHRSIILAQGRNYWVYEYLFAKKDRDNIEDDELSAFRDLAKIYARLTGDQIARLVQNRPFEEICNDKTQIQE